MHQFGIEHAFIFEPDRWWPVNGSLDDLPNPSAATHWMGDIAGKNGQMILDVERWSLLGGESDVREAVRRYTAIVSWLRAAGYAKPLGYYNVIPIWDRTSAIQPNASADHRRWQTHNDLLRPLLDQVDILFPSLYTDDSNVDHWVEFATAHIREARRIANGKPVYAFIWPQFHDSNREIGLQYLPAGYWQTVLQVVTTLADGAVIWGGWDFKRNRPAIWDESADWWAVTKRFLEAHPTCSRLGGGGFSLLTLPIPAGQDYSRGA